MANSSCLLPGTKPLDQELWYDVDKNQHYIMRNGVNTACNSMGQPVKKFVLYASGHYDYKKRVQYCAETKTTDMLALRPQSLGVADSRKLYHPSQHKFNGYMQFPRPLSNIFCNATQDDWQTKFKDATQQLKRIHLKSIVNEKYIKEYKDPKQTCQFFSQQKSACATAYPTSPRTEEGMVNNAHIEQVHAATWLPQKPKMFGSTLKTSHMDSLRSTFTNFRNLKGVSEQTQRFLTADEEYGGRGMKPMSMGNTSNLGKTLKDITKELKRESDELEGYIPPIVKEKRIAIKGIYNIKVESEGELYNRAVLRRKLVNSVAANEEQRRENLDRKLLEKHRNQRLLKNKAMETIIKAKEKALAKEISNKAYEVAKNAASISS